MFRRERPQKGRYRQFHQIDVEILGPDDPHIDAELLVMVIHFLRSVGLSSLNLEINSLGCEKCRPGFREAIVSFLRGREERALRGLPPQAFHQPLRIFDCKVEPCGRS
jgi:histidyl-tRNA synthetase